VIPFDTLFVWSMAAIILAISYRGIRDYTVPAIRAALK
jgi:hypothetical protein